MDEKNQGLKPDFRPPEEARPHRARGPSLAPVALLLGLCLVAAAILDFFADFLAQEIGLQRVLAGALGFLFLYVAWLARGQARLRERLLDLMEEVLRVFYGPDFRRERQAIDILVNAMESDSSSVRESSREHLIRLTGNDQGEDAVAWADWWDEHRSNFRSPKTGETAS